MLDLTKPAPAHPAPNGLANDERWQATEKIANSEGFRRSPRLQEFLRYIAEQQLSGHSEEITEQNVGNRVYKRRETYNPTEDNIVRVSARQLRLKLREYYESEGSGDSWIVEIPKGGYVPHFRKQERPVLAQGEQAQTNRPDLGRWLVTGLIALAAMGAGWLIPHPVHQAQPSKLDFAPNLITVLFHNSTEPIQVVVSDSGFHLLQSMLDRRVSIQEYARQNYPPLPPNLISPKAERVWTELISRQLVNLGDIGATNRFRDALAKPDRTSMVLMRSAQNVRARDFRSGNFILLGDASSNPWAQLFSDAQSDFQFIRTPSSNDPAILNLHPKPGEQHLYTNRNGFGYARIALVPNLTNTGRVLLIAGTSMEATESAANFCLDTQSSRTLFSALGGSQTIPDFEALLKTYEQGGTGLKAELVMSRMLTPERLRSR